MQSVTETSTNIPLMQNIAKGLNDNDDTISELFNKHMKNLEPTQGIPYYANTRELMELPAFKEVKRKAVLDEILHLYAQWRFKDGESKDAARAKVLAIEEIVREVLKEGRPRCSLDDDAAKKLRDLRVCELAFAKIFQEKRPGNNTHDCMEKFWQEMEQLKQRGIPQHDACFIAAYQADRNLSLRETSLQGKYDHREAWRNRLIDILARNGLYKLAEEAAGKLEDWSVKKAKRRCAKYALKRGDSETAAIIQGKLMVEDPWDKRVGTVLKFVQNQAKNREAIPSLLLLACRWFKVEPWGTLKIITEISKTLASIGEVNHAISIAQLAEDLRGENEVETDTLPFAELGEAFIAHKHFAAAERSANHPSLPTEGRRKVIVKLAQELINDKQYREAERLANHESLEPKERFAIFKQLIRLEARIDLFEQIPVWDSEYVNTFITLIISLVEHHHFDEAQRYAADFVSRRWDWALSDIFGRDLKKALEDHAPHIAEDILGWIKSAPNADTLDWVDQAYLGGDRESAAKLAKHGVTTSEAFELYSKYANHPDVFEFLYGLATNDGTRQSVSAIKALGNALWDYFYGNKVEQFLMDQLKPPKKEPGWYNNLPRVAALEQLVQIQSWDDKTRMLIEKAAESDPHPYTRLVALCHSKSLPIAAELAEARKTFKTKLLNKMLEGLTEKNKNRRAPALADYLLREFGKKGVEEFLPKLEENIHNLLLKNWKVFRCFDTASGPPSHRAFYLKTGWTHATPHAGSRFARGQILLYLLGLIGRHTKNEAIYHQIAKHLANHSQHIDPFANKQKEAAKYSFFDAILLMARNPQFKPDFDVDEIWTRQSHPSQGLALTNHSKIELESLYDAWKWVRVSEGLEKEVCREILQDVKESEANRVMALVKLRKLQGCYEDSYEPRTMPRGLKDLKDLPPTLQRAIDALYKE